LNKRLLQESYFIRNILDLSAIMALGNLKPNISWHSITVWMSLVLNNFIKNRLTEKSDKELVELTNIINGSRKYRRFGETSARGIHTVASLN